eukprot:Filipodium_phascolosomae@DN3424_c0_g1_i1.p1
MHDFSSCAKVPTSADDIFTGGPESVNFFMGIEDAVDLSALTADSFFQLASSFEFPIFGEFTANLVESLPTAPSSGSLVTQNFNNSEAVDLVQFSNLKVDNKNDTSPNKQTVRTLYLSELLGVKQDRGGLYNPHSSMSLFEDTYLLFPRDSLI